MQHAVPAPIPALSGWQPDARLVELECLSPLTDLAPGECAELTVTWQASAPTD